MDHLDRLLRRQAGSNQLPPAAESQHQMLLNKPQRNVQVRRHKPLVDINRRSASRLAQEPMLCQRLRVMAHHGILRGDIRPNNRIHLVLGRPAMQPGGNQDRDPLRRNPRRVQPFQQRRQRPPVRRRSRNVAYADRRRLFTPRQLHQRCRRDWMIQRIADRRGLILHRLRRMAHNHLGPEPLRNRNLKTALAKRKTCFHPRPLIQNHLYLSPVLNSRSLPAAIFSTTKTGSPLWISTKPHAALF